ncbi:MauE/DoxX family redox-associated membrane protein [Mesorhizobium sp. LHD-90]|uniref:MauE/DoxX family redox-associated membrane protein n=1 Tax=Mesorhizobium sp. LHD-90 TaxID=3071414 RepID=UPI0027E0A184|nr:MauE/DoxX family redox-associated membrane protein [Mesorhizobium sp. LHD-90]MDQ6434415.1 MauE/DoxX family redox-associated membrane protein [Mesorhizobium sp. LHD-90]
MVALHPILIVVAAGALVCVFARAALHKAVDPAMFAHTMNGYRVLPRAAVQPAAFGLIVLECAVVLGLIVPTTRPYAAAIGLVLLVLYASVIALNLARGNDHIDCGCGGAGQGLSWFLVLRNAALATLCLVAMAAPLPVPMTAAAWASAAAGILSFLLLFAGVEKLIDNWSWLRASNRAFEQHHHEGHH